MFQRIIRAVQKRGHKIETPASSRNLHILHKHVERHFGADGYVLHEVVSSVVHVDVHVIRPVEDRPYWVLLTSGMSDLDLHVPDHIAACKQIELVLCLPKEWPLNEKDDRWKQPELFWPIGGLKLTAKYPHFYETWLGPGHSIEGEASGVIGGRFAGSVLRRPTLLPEGFESLNSEDGREIQILTLCPLLAEEMTFKLNHGFKELESKLRAANVTELLDPLRPSACPVQ